MTFLAELEEVRYVLDCLCSRAREREREREREVYN